MKKVILSLQICIYLFLICIELFLLKFGYTYFMILFIILFIFYFFRKNSSILMLKDELDLRDLSVNKVENSIENKVIKEMENACDPFLSLDVPLKVEFGIGENWNSAH